MDRSFLSDARVIQASRDFVCLRLSTFEDAEEAVYLKKVYGRGDLENTVFAILAPDGKTKLSRSGRRPSFRNAAQMAAWMQQVVARDYSHAAQKRGSDTTLPEVKSLDLAINVASCDGLPVIVGIGQDEAELSRLRKQMLAFAWTDDLAGQFVFATTTSDADLRAISGLDDQPSGVYVLAPDTFGVSAEVLAKLDSEAQTHEQLADVLANFEPPKKSHRQHVQNGFLLGLKWETAIPVTDKQGAAAARRLWSAK